MVESARDQYSHTGDEETAIIQAHGSMRDRRAEFLSFMTESEPTLGRLAYFLASDRLRAEDLLQHTYARTYAAWPRIREGNPLAYARRVMSNHRADLWRRRPVEVPTNPLTLPDNCAPSADHGVANRAALEAALRTLTARRRRVVVLRYLLDLSEAEVAETLGISRGTVKSTAARGLAQLRTALTNSEREEW